MEEQNPRRVEAQAHGTGAEQARRVPVVEATLRLRTPATVLPTEAGAHSDAKLRELAGKRVAAAIGDHGSRRRDEGAAGPAEPQETADPRWDKRPQEQQRQRCGPADCRVAAAGAHGPFHGEAARTCRGAARDGVPGTRRGPGLGTPETTTPRQVACCQGTRAGDARHTDRMTATSDTERGRQRLARRVATGAPGFGPRRHTTRRDRGTLWRRAKGDGPWQLPGLPHTSEQRAEQGSGR